MFSFGSERNGLGYMFYKTCTRRKPFCSDPNENDRLTPIACTYMYISRMLCDNYRNLRTTQITATAIKKPHGQPELKYSIRPFSASAVPAISMISPFVKYLGIWDLLGTKTVKVKPNSRELNPRSLSPFKNYPNNIFSFYIFLTSKL